jgi:hypothetical protein
MTAAPRRHARGEFFKQIFAPTENLEPTEIFGACAMVVPGSVGA